MKVSFDFDSTLDRPVVQDYAKSLIQDNIEVWIVTSRMSKVNTDWNKDLFLVADKLGILKENIVFTEMSDKFEFFKDKDFIWHLDDDWVELNLINEHCKDTWGFGCFGNSVWKNKCDKLLKVNNVTNID